ncbi:sigma factor-like helix-turn-helix DNA-binding protein [Pseudonocardia sp. ICBG601]|uniref:sigma factor-like helix-turn-helix DNA-binding protein n=1 Tax=Pseudonocardia sp. ICBG601 TaxID=2846759 RepID=UPI0035ABBEF3
MTARTVQRRTRTARDLAEQFGVTPRTIRAMLAESRDEYERRAQRRRAEVVTLRLRGLTYQEIAERVGSTVGTVGRLLADARRNGEWATAMECHTVSHAE